MSTAIFKDKLQPLTNIGIWLPIILVEICIAAVGSLLPIKEMLIILISTPLVCYLLAKPLHAYILTILLLPLWELTLGGVGNVGGQIDIRYTQIVAAIAILSWFFNGLITKKLSFEKNILYFPIALFVGWIMLSLVWSLSFYMGFRDLLLTFNGVIIFFLTINTVKDEETLNIVLKAWVVTGLLCALMGMVELITTTIPNVKQLTTGTIEHWGPSVRLSGFRENPHRFGFLLNACLMIALTQLITSKSKKYTIFLVLCIFNILVVLTNIMSRSTWVGCIAGIICCSFYSKRLAKACLISGLVVIVLFLALAPDALQHAVIERFKGIMNPMETRSIIGRSSVWDAGIKMFMDNPLIGVGIGSFPLLSDAYGSVFLDAAHNVYIHLLSSFGLIGFTIFLFLFFTIAASIAKGFKYISNEGHKLVLLGISLGLAIFFIQGIVVIFKFIELEFWALLGLIMAALNVYMPQDEKMHVGSSSTYKSPPG